VAYKPESEWTSVAAFAFAFSLHMNSLIEVTRGGGAPMCGYFKGLHRGTAAIAIATPLSQQDVTAGIGSKTLKSFRKFSVDRLGRISGVPGEVRTWRGAACT
jgi:CRISPR-associated endonuclease Csn1